MAKKLFPDGTEVVPFYVRAIRSGPLVFVSGTTSLDSKGRVQGKDAAEQTTITMRKIEAALKISPRTIRRDWDFAKAWLLRELSHTKLSHTIG